MLILEKKRQIPTGRKRALEKSEKKKNKPKKEEINLYA
jgi:hypothetical protein